MMQKDKIARLHRHPMDPPLPVRDCWSRIFYRLDALPVTNQQLQALTRAGPF